MHISTSLPSWALFVSDSFEDGCVDILAQDLVLVPEEDEAVAGLVPGQPPAGEGVHQGAHGDTLHHVETDGDKHKLFEVLGRKCLP